MHCFGFQAQNMDTSLEAAGGGAVRYVVHGCLTLQSRSPGLPLW